ncbi:MAG: T9SS type A sorting domain-containing protein [Salinibacter sp.]
MRSSSMQSDLTIYASVVALLLACVVGLPFHSAQAQDDVSVTVPSVGGDDGETITLGIEADLGGNEAEGFTKMEFTFDGSIATITDVNDGSELSFGSDNLTTNLCQGESESSEGGCANEIDTLRVSNLTSSPVSGSGEFLQIEVQLEVDGGTPFELTPSQTDDVIPTSVFEAPDENMLEVSDITQGFAGDAAQAQFIHNAADPNAQTVDIYFDGIREVDDFDFRSATPLADIKSGVPIEIGVAPGGSQDSSDIIYTQTATFEPESAYTVTANGVLDPSGFADNPDGEAIDFGFSVASGAEASAPSGDVGVRAVHGATDAPTVDIDDDGSTLLDNLTYGDVTADYLEVPAEEKQFVVTPGDGETVVATFDADLSGLGGDAAAVLASGFLDPTANQDGPPLRLIAALPNGDVVTFEPAEVIPVQQARQQGPDSTVTVEGTVTRAFGAYVRLQDNSGPTGASGLVVRQTSGDLSSDFQQDIEDGTITQGTTLQVTGTLSEFNGLLQINDDDLSDYSVEGQGSLPEVQEVTFAELQGADGEDYESELIRVEGVAFQDPDTTGGTLDSGTDYTVEDEEGTAFTYRVQQSNETDVIGAPIPADAFNYEGVLGQFNGGSGEDEGYQLLPVRTSTGLPVELAGFDAVQSGSSVELTWQTASETNNAGFQVQHQKGEGDAWTDLGFVESKAGSGGTTSEAKAYRYEVEEELAPGTHAFRLKQVDIDGTPHYSEAEAIEVQMDQSLRLSAPAPNPASGQATVRFAVQEPSETEVAVYNVLGQRVQTLYEGQPPAGQEVEATVDTGSLSSGTYFVRIQSNDNVRSERLTVVR